MARKRSEETKLQMAVVQHLKLRGVKGLVFFHVPNGGARTAAEGAIFKAMGVRAGVSDLILLHNNKTFCLELKAPGGRLSEHQLAFLGEADAAGAFTAVPEGLDAALATLGAWGLLRQATIGDVLRASTERAG